MNTNNLKSIIPSAIKLLFGLLLLLIFISGGLFILFTFGNSSFDTTSITNVGFAIFAGCASVCFAWARTSDIPADTKKIKQFGEGLFLSALCFVLASLAKLVGIHQSDLIPANRAGYFELLFPLLNVLSAIMFLIAYLTAWASILGLMKILFRKSISQL